MYTPGPFGRWGELRPRVWQGSGGEGLTVCRFFIPRVGIFIYFYYHYCVLYYAHAPRFRRRHTRYSIHVFILRSVPPPPSASARVVVRNPSGGWSGEGGGSSEGKDVTYTYIHTYIYTCRYVCMYTSVGEKAGRSGRLRRRRRRRKGRIRRN